MIGQLPGEWWVFIIFGIGAGIISGALGVGSGVVLIPILVLLCGFEQKSAQGTALAVMVPMALVGAIRYWRNPQIELNGLIILLLMVGAVAGALVGTELAARLSGDLLRKSFAVFLMIVAVRMFTLSPQRGHLASTIRQPPAQETIGPGGSNDSASQR